MSKPPKPSEPTGRDLGEAPKLPPRELPKPPPRVAEINRSLTQQNFISQHRVNLQVATQQTEDLEGVNAVANDNADLDVQLNNSPETPLKNTPIKATYHQLINQDTKADLKNNDNISNQSRLGTGFHNAKDLGDFNIIAGCELKREVENGHRHIILCVKEYDKPTKMGNLQTPNLEYSAYERVFNDLKEKFVYAPLTGSQLANDFNINMGKIHGNKDGTDFNYPLSREEKSNIADSFKPDNLSKLAIDPDYTHTAELDAKKDELPPPKRTAPKP